MAKRKNLTKKVRFEVFKRDSFKCQYCGKEAPNVILEVDHIKPVVEGGSNDLINLITSCFDCNRGKGKRQLNDDSVAKLEKQELNKLKLRKEQMDFYVEWKKELINVVDKEYEALEDLFATIGREWTESGKREVVKLIKKYGFKECYDSLEICIDQYKPEQVGDKLSKVLAGRKSLKENPHLKDVYYIRAIVKNRMHCVDWKAKDLIETAILSGYPVEDLKTLAKTSKNWSQWKWDMEDIINGRA